jgi:hypothetical protein
MPSGPGCPAGVLAVDVLEALDVPLEDELLDPHPATKTTIASATIERARIEAGTVQGV